MIEKENRLDGRRSDLEDEDRGEKSTRGLDEAASYIRPRHLEAGPAYHRALQARPGGLLRSRPGEVTQRQSANVAL